MYRAPVALVLAWLVSSSIYISDRLTWVGGHRMVGQRTSIVRHTTTMDGVWAHRTKECCRSINGGVFLHSESHEEQFVVQVGKQLRSPCTAAWIYNHFKDESLAPMCVHGFWQDLTDQWPEAAIAPELAPCGLTNMLLSVQLYVFPVS